MKNFDHLQLDGRLLQLLLTVMEERSVTRAAARLDMTQSAVSHALDKLRLIVDDPLFVKSGRGISPTVRAEALAQHARSLLEDMRRFVSAACFDPARLQRTISIAANDLQRDLLLPRLLNLLQAEAPGVSLRVLPSGIPTVEMLRSDECDLVITPRPPDGSDIVQKRLFADHYRVFYDAGCRAAPASLDDYLAAEHVTVGYTPPRMLDIDDFLAGQGIRRRIAAWLPGFAGIAPFVQGSTRLATLPGLLASNLLAGLASCAPPLPCPDMPMYLVWHQRHRHDPLHIWLRQRLEQVTQQALAAQLPG